MRARLINEVGTRGVLRIYWDVVLCDRVDPCDQCPGGHPHKVWQSSCPNSYGRGRPGVHNAITPIGDVPELGAWGAFGDVGDHPEERWPTSCRDCGAAVPPVDRSVQVVGDSWNEVTRQVFTERLYDTESGVPEPGDLYYTSFHDPGHCPYWDNCDGRHLHGVVPNGDHWDIDSRCSNCTLREDRLHRCWVRSGTPEDGTLHVGKGGLTCAAGAGSIQTAGWHGFLHGMSWSAC